MAFREFTPLSELLPDVLGRLARDAPSAPLAPLAALWTRVQGPVIGAQSRPAGLADGTLTVQVRSTTWRATLESQETVLRERWNVAVRTAPVRRIVFQLGPT